MIHSYHCPYIEYAFRYPRNVCDIIIIMSAEHFPLLVEVLSEGTRSFPQDSVALTEAAAKLIRVGASRVWDLLMVM